MEKMRYRHQMTVSGDSHIESDKNMIFTYFNVTRPNIAFIGHCFGSGSRVFDAFCLSLSTNI